MAQRENKEAARIILALQKRYPGARMFRNSTGYCRETRVRYGLAEGSADLVGWIPRVITAEMIGQTIAQFATIEVKALDSDVRKCRTTEAQLIWARNVNDAGGIAVFLSDGEELIID